MPLLNLGNNEQKLKKKEAEKILDNLVGGLMPTRTRLAFFKRMNTKGIKPSQQEKVRLEVLKTIKREVANDELEPTTEAINLRIEQILNVHSRVVLQEREVQRQSKISELEEKFGIVLTGKVWFKCSIEEVKYSTFTNEKRRNFDNAYVIINKDNFEIIKESYWLKTNMSTRKLYFDNITSLDYDARGLLHASSSVIINTKSAEHVQLKFVTANDFNLMNNAYDSYFEKTHRVPQTEQIPQKISQTSSADELLKYAELYEKGLLTKEEFDLKKSQLLVNESTTMEQSISTDRTENRFCTNCGCEIEAGSKFCANCGSKI